MKKTVLLWLIALGFSAISNAQIPTDGLVASYPFNGNANDESATANHGIVDGAVLTTDRNGASNSAYWFDGIDDAIRITGALPVTNEFTISFWAYSENTSGYHNVICDGSSGTGGRDFLLVFRDDHIGIRADKDAPLNYEDSSPPELQNLGLLNNWVHVVWRMTPTASTVYLNGSELITINQAGSNAGYHDAYSFIGARQVWGSPDYFFQGKLDDIFIYDRALESSEIAALYDGQLTGSVTDIDGNSYSTIRIGNQVWMQENLKTTRYQNGDLIGTTTSPTLDIQGEAEPKYQWAYNGFDSLVDSLGRLYTWYVATDSRNVCPAGWHVPSFAEWNVLADYLTNNAYGYSGSGNDIGKAMALTTSWAPHPTPGNVGNDLASNNSSGFSGYPAGARHSSGLFNLWYQYTFWWSSTENMPNVAHHKLLRYDGCFLEENSFVNMGDGYSIRCLQDTEYQLWVNDLTVNEGEAIELPVSMGYVPATENIISYQFNVSYDAATLVYTGSDLAGTLAEGGTVEVNSTVAGTLSVSYMNSTPLEGEGEILKLQFNALVADTTEVSLSSAYLNSTVVDELGEGQLIIRDITPPEAELTYSQTDARCGDMLLITASFSEPMLENTPVLLEMNGAVSQVYPMDRNHEREYSFLFPVPRTEGTVALRMVSGTDLWGNPVQSVPLSGESFTILPLHPGDVDDDGIVLAYDAALTLQHSVGLDPLPQLDPLPWENWRDSTANVDGEPGITANDAGMILQYSAGLISDFSGGTKKSAANAVVSMQFTYDGIIFHSYGPLLGLNISMLDDIHVLGAPEMLYDGLMSAQNIDENTYKIGLCMHTPPPNGEALLKIPFSANGAVEVQMMVNTQLQSMSLNLATGIDAYILESVRLYPNPVGESLKVEGIQGGTQARIYSSDGRLQQHHMLESVLEEIDVSELPAGFYILKLEKGQASARKRFVKR